MALSRRGGSGLSAVTVYNARGEEIFLLESGDCYLSVLALNTFTVAYGNFMMAFLLCQDKSMWTMMVHLYQLQIRSSQAVGFAALIIAAVPTLLVFIFCQNIIIKGIVVPTEK